MEHTRVPYSHNTRATHNRTMPMMLDMNNVNLDPMGGALESEVGVVVAVADGNGDCAVV